MCIPMAKLDGVRQEFVDFWGSLASYWGIPPATARVYAWLISQARPCTADEIVEGRKRRIYFYNPNGKLFAQADGVRGVVLVR